MPFDSDLYKINEEMTVIMEKISRQKENKCESYLKFFDKMLNSLSNISAKVNFGCKIISGHHVDCLENFSISIYKEFQISDLTNRFDRLKNLNTNANNCMKKLLSSLRSYFEEIEKLKNDLNNIITHTVNTKKDEMILTQQSNFMKNKFSEENLMNEMKEEKPIENKKYEKKVNFQDNFTKSGDFQTSENTARNPKSPNQLLESSLQTSMNYKYISKSQENFYTEERLTQPNKTEANYSGRNIDISKVFEDPRKMTAQNYLLKKNKVDISSNNEELIQDYINYQSEYVYVKKLSVNQNSVVALCSKSTKDLNGKELVILKIYNQEVINSDVLSSETLLNISLVHQNILKTHHLIKNLNIVVMEYVNLGQISKFLTLNKNILEEKFCFLLFIQILDSIDFLHNLKKMPHKNLNIDQFLINDSFQIKLCELSSVNITSKIEPNIYEPPEINLHKLLNKPTDFYKVDVYALGVILHFILLREFPNKKKLIKVKASYEAQTLLTGMLNEEPIKRFSFKDIKNHDWLTKNMKEFQSEFRRFSYQKNKYAYTFMSLLKENIVI